MSYLLISEKKDKYFSRKRTVSDTKKTNILFMSAVLRIFLIKQLAIECVVQVNHVKQQTFT
jgi:hypothetical protein